MTATASRLVPYITAREGEEADSFLALRASFGADGRSRLSYWDESRDDRDVRGTLWARTSQSIGRDGMPVGSPRWRLVHPARQRHTMMNLLCQVCVGPTKTPDGYLFLESGTVPGPGVTVRTAQPPVCLKHAHAAAKLCPNLVRHGHVALMVQSAPLYGVIGTPYQWSSDGVQTLAGDDIPLPYGSPNLRWFLASQLVRTLRAFTVIDLDDLAPAA
ncbi:hypothetical protein QF037_006332 [Streptomyces canus]|uniref:hypothetical protein n=1 Tax=Streptomyces canus TaxID=58343 RepID=UPI002780F894|nr:hypothetical protein [Streptomyces canus]MDQ0601987.1 hypothetical protein [Streptomyces canus]